MKRVFSIMLAVMMLMLLAMPALGEEEKGSITINGISEGNVYSIYRIMDLESYDTTSGAYSYKANDAWTGFFATTEALDYVTVDSAGYITWIAAEDDDTVAAFAKLALAYAKEKGITPVKSSNNTDDGFDITYDDKGKPVRGRFSNLDLGYYLIDSTMGALCGLTTTNPNASIQAKNAIPTIDKQVQEDSTGQWGDSNTADIGQTVYFRVTIEVHAGAQNYVLHDDMSAGLTFNGVTKIEHIVPGSETKELEADTDYTVVTSKPCTVYGDKCTFEVRFTEELCDTLENNDKLVVYYEAMLNRNAVVAGDGNTNSATLEFGENHKTTEDKIPTYTFGFNIIKTDSQNKLIDGAEFKIYDAETGGNEVPVVLMDDGVTYRRARADETGIAIKVKNGNVRVHGFDNGTYYLEETKTPAGYNQLTARQKFIISDANLDATFNDGIYSTGSGVHVVNKTGSMLPETGGLGTTLFIAFGGFAALCTGVILFAKKRMSQLEEE